MRRRYLFSGSGKLAIFVAALLACAGWALGAGRGLYSSEASRSAADKLRHIQDAATAGQGIGSIRISEAELNAYLDDTQPDLPQGISAIRIKLQPSRPTGTAEVDFDRLKGGMKTQPNPLLAMFLRGEHTIGVEGTFTSSNGEGQFRIDSATLDGITVPQMLVDYLIESYLRPHYPNFPIDRPFVIGSGIEQVTVEAGGVLITGRPAGAGGKLRKPDNTVAAPLTLIRTPVAERPSAAH